MGSLLLVDKNGKYFPVIDGTINDIMKTPQGLVWVTGVTKARLQEIGLEIYDIYCISSWYQYSYLVEAGKYFKYLSTLEPPVVLERH